MPMLMGSTGPPSVRPSGAQGVRSATATTATPYQRADDALAFTIWRFLTGAPLDGVVRTNATWAHRATAVYTDVGRLPGRWSRWPRLARAAIRWAGLAVAGWAAASYQQDPEGTVRTVGLTLVAAVCLAGFGLGWRTAGRALTARHRRDWVLPTHVAVRRLVDPNIPADADPATYMSIPRNYAESGGHPIRIELPADYLRDQMRDNAIVTGMSTKLGLQDVEPRWHLRGRDHYLMLYRRVYPPDVVVMDDADVMALIEGARESAPLAGLTHGRIPVYLDFDVDSPHWLVVGGSGGGKSVLVMAVMAQGLHNGWAASFLDRKLVSHKWARGIPGTDYWRTIPQMHEGLCVLGRELARRNAIVDAWDDDDSDPDVGPRHFVIIEEANATVRKLKAYYDATKGPGDPKKSPALEALEDLQFMGREFRMHVVMAAQSGTVNALGGPEIRENFAIRSMARYTVNAWRMLVPEVTPIPRSERHRGRWQMVIGGLATPTQVLYLGKPNKMRNQARAWALSGVRPVEAGGSPAWQAYVAGELPELPADDLVSSVSSVSSPSPTRANADDMSSPPHLRVVSDDPRAELVTLREALAEGLVGPTLGAVKRASTRDPEFPPPAQPAEVRGQEHRYRRNELAAWHAGRLSSARVTRAEGE